MDIGALINEQYQIIEHIGRGGMADVWSARDTRLNRMVAIKTIVPGLGSDFDPVALFKREAQTIAQMQHPHILPIHDFGEHEGSLYIVMRYVTGGSLEDMMRDGPLAPEVVLKLGDEIGRALDYAHDNNVIHLDLKPPNILLDSAKSPYLADFGLATALDPEGRAKNPGGGTMLYMAPEQFISETIDKSADIYSFTIMLFHMLTGRLPFDGNSSLAMKQMQHGEEMPYIDDYISSLPSELTEILRLGTSKDPNYRPETHKDLMDQFRSVVQPTAMDVVSDAFDDDFVLDGDPYNMLTEVDLDLSDSGLLEAVDIYSRAVFDWQGGQGRFLLGITHFMLMNEYYQNAEKYNLPIDEQGHQMFLRGAIEYDYELEYWWKRVSNDDRRWVCLHALRSGNAPARIRALSHLETLPDEEGRPVIHKLVAQMLEQETDNTAKKAAMKVLAIRARLMSPQNFDIMDEHQGRLLTSMTRLGIQIGEPAFWQNYVYSIEIDLLIAEVAFDQTLDVAEYAARTIGKMRSLAAIKHIAEEQRNGRKGALEALAFIRDEAPALPKEVSRDARIYAWITNTVRRLTDNPLDSILRFILALVGSWIAMGDHVYTLFISSQLLSAARWGNTLGMGLIFGVIVALTFYLTDEISRRLEGFWPWWMRLGITGFLGYVMAILIFASVRWIFYNDPDIAWDLMRFLGAAMAFGLVATASLRLRGWRGVIVTTIVLFIPIFAAYRVFYNPVLGYTFTLAPLAPIALLLGMLCGWRASQLSALGFQFSLGKTKALPPRLQTMGFSIALSIILALAWAWGTWLYFDYLIAGVNITWDTILWMVAIILLLGAIAAFWLPTTGRISFAITALLAFAGLYALNSWQFFDYSYTIPLMNPIFEVIYLNGTLLIAETPEPLIQYNLLENAGNINDIFTVTLPMIFVVALAVNIQPLVVSWLDWIGKATSDKERGGWLSLTLLYILTMTSLVSVLSLFSAHISIIWALGWSFWGVVTFILALATFRWAKWGAQGLMWSAIFFIFAGFFFDYVNMRFMADSGHWPAYLQVIPIRFQLLGLELTFTATQMHFWGLWSVFIGLFAWGAQGRKLWAGIGLVVMLIGWVLVSLFSPLQGSITVFAVSNVALLAYVLAPKYELMENERFTMPRLRALPLLPEASPSQLAFTEFRKSETGELLPTQLVTIPQASADAIPPTIILEDNISPMPEVIETDYDPQAEAYEDDLNLGHEDETHKHEIDTVAYNPPDPSLIYSEVDARSSLSEDEESQRAITKPKIDSDDEDDE